MSVASGNTSKPIFRTGNGLKEALKKDRILASTTLLEGPTRLRSIGSKEGGNIFSRNELYSLKFPGREKRVNSSDLWQGSPT